MKEKRCKFSYHDIRYYNGDRIDNGWWCSLSSGNTICNGLKKTKRDCPLWNKR